MFISMKRYNEEKELANRRMSEFEKTLHELYDAHLELKDKYNRLLSANNNISSRLEVIELDASLRNGDRSK